MPAKVRLRFRQRSGPGGSRCSRASRPSTMCVGVSRGRLRSQASGLGLGMPEHPRLDRLRRRRDVEEPPDVPQHDRVLDRDPGDRRPEHVEEERRGVPEVGPAVAGGAVLPAAAEVEMLRAAIRQEGAWRVRDQQVPAIVQDGAHVAEDVRARPLARQHVARHGVVAAGPERIADHAREFAGNEDTHVVTLRPTWACASGSRKPTRRPSRAARPSGRRSRGRRRRARHRGRSQPANVRR